MSDTVIQDVEQDHIQAPQFVQDATAGNVLPVTSLTISECGGLSDQIKSLLSAHSTISLDLQACEDIDTAGLQLLTILQLDPETTNRVRWRNPHGNVLTQASRLALTQWIQSGVELS